MAQKQFMAIKGGKTLFKVYIWTFCSIPNFTEISKSIDLADFTFLGQDHSQDADLVQEGATAPPSLTFLALMHRRWRRGHLHSQAVSSPERVAVPNDKGSRLPLSQHADGCNAVSIWVS